jgi:hypothetical protein
VNSKHISIPAGLVLQPGATISVNAEGKWSSTLTYLAKRNGLAGYIPAIGAPHPEFPFMVLSGVSITVSEGDVAEVVCDFAGTDESNRNKGKATTVYTLGVATSEEPLLSHMRYQNLPDAEREALRNIGSGKEEDAQGNSYRSNVNSDIGQEILKRFDRGQTSYLSPKITWRQSWVQDTKLDNTDLNDIGNIAEPEGNPPMLAQGRNWLCTAISQTQESKKAYRIEIEWMASDRGGWDENVYSDEVMPPP